LGWRSSSSKRRRRRKARAKRERRAKVGKDGKASGREDEANQDPGATQNHPK
jgi:hypothetical protein